MDIKISRWWLGRLLFSGLWRRVVWCYLLPQSSECNWLTLKMLTTGSSDTLVSGYVPNFTVSHSRRSSSKFEVCGWNRINFSCHLTKKIDVHFHSDQHSPIRHSSSLTADGRPVSVLADGKFAPFPQVQRVLVFWIVVIINNSKFSTFY